MDNERFAITIERRDPARNMARFYRLAIDADLFGEIVVVRRWGRIGADGQKRTHVCADRSAALDLFLTLLKGKLRRGYRPHTRRT